MWVPYLGHPPAKTTTTSWSTSSDVWDDDGWGDDGLETIGSDDGWGNGDHLINMPTPKPWIGDDWVGDSHDWDDEDHVVLLPIEPLPPSPPTIEPPMLMPPPPADTWNDDVEEGNSNEDTLDMVNPPSPTELRNDGGRERVDSEETSPTEGLSEEGEEEDVDDKEEDEKDEEESEPRTFKIAGSARQTGNAGENPDAMDAVPTGAVIGAVVAATVLAVGLVLFVKKKRSAKNVEKEIDPEGDYMMEEDHFYGDPDDPDADIPPPPPMQANNDGIEIDESFLNLDEVSEAVEFDDLESV